MKIFESAKSCIRTPEKLYDINNKKQFNKKTKTI